MWIDHLKRKSINPLAELNNQKNVYQKVAHITDF